MSFLLAWAKASFISIFLVIFRTVFLSLSFALICWTVFVGRLLIFTTPMTGYESRSSTNSFTVSFFASETLAILDYPHWLAHCVFYEAGLYIVFSIWKIMRKVVVYHFYVLYKVLVA